MSCPGIHCPGCSGGQSAGIAAAVVVGLAVAYESVAWVAENIVWIALTMAACFVLSVAASMWLEARTARRAAAWGAARGIYSRADYIAPLPARATAGLPSADARLAIAPPSIVVNIFGQPTDEQAAVIRRALGG